MFVGHGLLAFALVAAGARWWGWSPERALRAGLVAGLFATLPDVDILYGPVGLLGGVSGTFEAAEAFWRAGNVVHRGPTHSLVVGSVVAVAAAAWRVDRSGLKLTALGALIGLVSLITLTGGGLAGTMTALVGAGALGLAVFAARLDLSARTVLAGALVGLLSHPFGDLLTGEPPAFLYPFDVTLFPARLAPFGDPTANLLTAFALELSAVWLGVAVLFWLRGGSLLGNVDRRAALGVVYAGAVFALPAPTLGTSYHFVFSVLGLGIVGVTPRSRLRLHWRRTVATALGTVTVAWVAYVAAYLLL